MNGTVKWFSKEKGYGFVQGEDGKEYFVHHTSVPAGAMLREDDKVTFDPAQTDRGWKADNLKLGEGDGAAAPADDAAEEAPADDAEEAPAEEAEAEPAEEEAEEAPADDAEAEPAEDAEAEPAEDAEADKAEEKPADK